MYIVKGICSIICMQAHRLPTGNLEGHRDIVKKHLEREIRLAINEDVGVFRSGMNSGPDLWAAETVLELRQRYFPDIQLHCYLPCETQANNWPEVWREKYFDILALADDVICLQSHYSRGCMTKRTREMLSGSSRLIAVHDNIADGAIDKTIGYAESKGIEAIVVRPWEGPDVPLDLSRRVIRLDSNQISSQTSSAYSEGLSTGTSAIRRA